VRSSEKIIITSKEALNNSSMNHSSGTNDRVSPEGVSLMDETNNDQSKNKLKCDFNLFFIFNNLAVIAMLF